MRTFPLDTLAEMAVGERRAVGLFLALAQSPVLTLEEQQWARRVAKDEISHARIEEYWLAKRGGSDYTGQNQYLVSARQRLLPSEQKIEPDQTIIILGYLWRAEREAAQCLPKWVSYLEADEPELAKDLTQVYRDEADHLRFHHTIYRRLANERPGIHKYLAQFRHDLMLDWPHIPGLSEVPRSDGGR